MDKSVFLKVNGIINKVQTNSLANQRCIILLKNIYKKYSLKSFWPCFEKILTVLLNIDFKIANLHAERVIEFCAAFCANLELDPKFKTQDDIDTLFALTLNFLLDVHDVESNIVRYRACQLIDKFLGVLVGTEISETLSDRIITAMIDRLKNDPKFEVRCQAVLAMYRLQNEEDPNCKIIPEILTVMGSANNWKLRKLCVEKIRIRQDVIAALVTQTADVKPEVRLAVFSRLSVLVKFIKISQRHTVVIRGFVETDKEIKKYMSSQFVLSWLNEYDNDYLALVKATRLDATEQLIGEFERVNTYMLNALFRIKSKEEIISVLKIGENSLQVVPLENLDWEFAIYWRLLSEYLRTSDKYESLLESVLPSLVSFSNYIKNYCSSAETDKSSLQFQFIVEQLFIICQGYDVADTVTRTTLTNLVKDTLCNNNLEPNTVVSVMKNLENTIPDVNQRIKFICEFMSDILYTTPTEDDTFQIKELKRKIKYTHEQQNNAVQLENFDKAALYNKELKELTESLNQLEIADKATQCVIKRTGSKFVLNWLKILRGLLLYKDLKSLTPELYSLNDNVYELLLDKDNSIRSKALECHALCCLLDKNLAQKGIQIFASNMFANMLEPSYDRESLIAAICAVSDLLAVYGPSICNATEKEEEGFPIINFSQVIQALVDLMNNEDVDLQQYATVGLCNLIGCGQVNSPALLSRMILKWCNPTSEHTEILRQVIGMMLEDLPELSGSAIQLEKSVLLTIKTLINAPKSSPLADVNIQNIITFMLSLCTICKEAINIHVNLAVAICKEIINEPDSTANLIFSRTLLMLELVISDYSTLHDLIELCEEAASISQNRLVLKNITKFVKYVKNLKIDDDFQTNTP